MNSLMKSHFGESCADLTTRPSTCDRNDHRVWRLFHEGRGRDHGRSADRLSNASRMNLDDRGRSMAESGQLVTQGAPGSTVSPEYI